MKILILGGTGLISSAMSRQFLESGVDLTIFNRGKTPLRIPAGATLISGDRNDFPAFERQMAEAGKFDCVIDMICFTKEQAESDIRAFRGRTGHFIFCSTVNVYTKPAPNYPVREDSPRIPINDDYGTKKAECEDLFFMADLQGIFPVSVMRPAQTYGEGGVIVHTLGWSTTYIDRIRKGKPIIVHGDGTNLWAPCHVDDVGRAFVNAAGNPRAFGKAYNTTGDEWMTWNQYHEGVAQALDAPPPKLVHIPTELLYKISPERSAITYNNFSGNNVFDNSAAKADLGFQHTVPWVEGVQRTVAWLDANGRIENSDDDPFDDRVIEAWERHSQNLLAELAAS